MLYLEISIRKVFVTLIAVILILLSCKNELVYGQSELTQLYTSENKEFSFRYPSEWHLSENTDENVLNFGTILMDNSKVKLTVSKPQDVDLYAISGFGTTPEEIANSHLAIYQSLQPTSISPTIVAQYLNETNYEPNTVIHFSEEKLKGSYYFSFYSHDTDTIGIYVFFVIEFPSDKVATLLLSVPYIANGNDVGQNILILEEIIRSFNFKPISEIGDGAYKIYSSEIGSHYKGMLTLKYPSDWYVLTAGNILIQNVTNSSNEELQTGQIRIVITQPEYNMKLFSSYEDIANCKVDLTKITALSLFDVQLPKSQQQVEQLTSQGISYTIPKEFSVNGLDIVSSYIKYPKTDNGYLAINTGNNMIFTLGIQTPTGELSQYQPDILTIIKNFHFEYYGCK